MFQCPVCAHSDSVEFFDGRDFFVTGETFPVMECTNCHFRWTSSAPDSEKIGKYYQSDDYISHSNTQKGIINLAYHFIRNRMLGHKYRIIRANTGTKSGSLLDIGAGTGYFLHFMLKRGWKISGIEKSPEARKFAFENFRLSLLPEEAFFSKPEKPFDVITLWHVMEHLHSPLSYWQRFPQWLTPSGILLIALPNPESTDARHYREYWAAWDVPRHLWHFSPGNIIQMAENAGFSLKKIYRMPFDAFYVSILSEKYKRKSKISLVKGIFWGMISWMISLFRLKKCSSLIYIFQLR